MAGRGDLIRRDIRGESFGTTLLMFLSNKLTYVGFHKQHDADEDGLGWGFKKLNYSGTKLLKVEEIHTSGCLWSGVTNAGWA